MINIKDMSQAEALDKIKKDSGTKFDPRLVRLFIKVISEEIPPSL
jgi:HD-GYP domain-containing protein (c-di-GMP phosphodiesterase class II)